MSKTGGSDCRICRVSLQKDEAALENSMNSNNNNNNALCIQCPGTNHFIFDALEYFHALKHTLSFLMFCFNGECRGHFETFAPRYFCGTLLRLPSMMSQPEFALP